MKSRLVVAAIIEKNGKILLGQKPKNIGPYPNTWHLPGGGVDLENETLEEAIRREIKEETGLEILVLDHVGFDEDYEQDKNGNMTHYVFLQYKATPEDVRAEANDDIENLKWFKKSELKHIPLARPLEKYLKKKGEI